MIKFSTEDFEEGMDEYLDLTSVFPHPASDDKSQKAYRRKSHSKSIHPIRKGKLARSIQRAIKRASEREKN